MMYICANLKMLSEPRLAMESAARKHKLCSGFAEIKNKKDPVTKSYLGWMKKWAAVNCGNAWKQIVTLQQINKVIYYAIAVIILEK